MNKRILFLIPILSLASCGAQVSKIVDAKLDHSARWADNYYHYFDASLKELMKKANVINLTTENKVFTDYDEFIETKLDANANRYNYYTYDESASFGYYKKLSLYDNGVKEGFPSKLFDGSMFCFGNFELARVQIDNDGFSSTFTKKIQSAKYLYLNFKAAHDFKSGASITPHLDDIELSITLYGKNVTTFKYNLIDVPTNYSEGPSAYTFFGFDISNFDISDTYAYSFSYTLTNEEDIECIDLAHALLLYEFGFGEVKY